jgi:hypothetical protein
LAASFATRIGRLYLFHALRVADGRLAKAQFSHDLPVGLPAGWRCPEAGSNGGIAE